jgi:hypothetical protein
MRAKPDIGDADFEDIKKKCEKKVNFQGGAGGGQGALGMVREGKGMLEDGEVWAYGLELPTV